MLNKDILSLRHSGDNCSDSCEKEDECTCSLEGNPCIQGNLCGNDEINAE